MPRHETEVFTEVRTPSALAIARFLRGMSQAELAERAGVSHTTVVSAENGRHVPRRSTAVALCTALRFDDPRQLIPEAFGDTGCRSPEDRGEEGSEPVAGA